MKLEITKKDFRRLEEIIANAPGALDKILRAASEEITNDIKLSFGSSPSADGDPPGVDTGTLRASMKWLKKGHLHYQVSDGVEYGQWLEYGNTRGLAPRPFFKPVLEQWGARKFGELMADLEGML